MNKPEKPFFVGYLPVPKSLRSFLLSAGLGLVVCLGVLSYAISGAADDPGPGAFRFDYGRQMVTGVVEMHPYPLLHVTKGTDRVPAGHTLMMSGGGKFGVTKRLAPFEGKLAQVTGIALERGKLDMLQVGGGRKAIVAAEGVANPVVREALGRWKITGEICDGKCLSGAMRPGRGLAHKACANLCLLGDIPPVFVSSKPVEGEEFLLVGSIDGKKISREIYDHIGLYVQAEGNLERRGDLLVFLIDPATIRPSK